MSPKKEHYFAMLNYGTNESFSFIKNSLIRVLNAVFYSFIPIFSLYSIIIYFFVDTHGGILSSLPVILGIIFIQMNRKGKANTVLKVWPVAGTLMVVAICIVMGEIFYLEAFLFGIFITVPFLEVKKISIVMYLIFIAGAYIFIKIYYMNFYPICYIEPTNLTTGIRYLNIFLSLWFSFYQLKIFREQFTLSQEELDISNQKLKESQKNINDSINYARRIQMGVFKNFESITFLFEKSFIFFKPRDVVAGDFYWFSKVDRYKVIVCADCTGHGVPGAFMTLLGTTYLDEIVNDFAVIQPNRILGELHSKLCSVLNNNTTLGDIRDGMDIAVMTFDEDNGKAYYSGANIPLYIYKNKTMETLNPEKFGLGGNRKNHDPEFTLQEIKLEKNMHFFMATDGFQDQNGGIDSKKYMRKNFKDLLVKISHLEVNQRRNELKNELANWITGHEQRDDILVMSIEI